MQPVSSTGSDKHLSKVIKIDETQIQNHLDKMVRSTVEETLNGLLDAEADQLCNAKRYERTSNGLMPERVIITGSCIPRPARWN